MKDSSKKSEQQNSRINKHTIMSWKDIEKTGKYRNAVRKETYFSASDRIESEVMDGIFLSLNERNHDKPMNVKLRLLRRIVEKRQAQANHEKSGRSNDRQTNIVNIINTSKSLEKLDRRRHAC